ncbi:MBL fold metallo-hydrolase [Streptomyces sp. NPDC008343]|uniref:MBL fold metallo-hydrolase n=1 Tax=Streptomyces sp. NPDC008343 TaxID=3364828 RepID=UPI0036E65E59
MAAQAVPRRQPPPAARPSTGPRRQRIRRPCAGDVRVGARPGEQPRHGREHPLAIRPRGGNTLLQAGGAAVAAGAPDARPSPAATPGAVWRGTSTSRSPPTPSTCRSTTGRSLRLGDADWQVVATPGHTPGHLALWQPEERLPAVGDALADYDVGWINLALDGPDAAALAPNSLRRLADLNPTLLLPAHGPIPRRSPPTRCRLRHRTAPRTAPRRRSGRSGPVRRPENLRLRPDDPRRSALTPRSSPTCSHEHG